MSATIRCRNSLGKNKLRLRKYVVSKKSVNNRLAASLGLKACERISQKLYGLSNDWGKSIFTPIFKTVFVKIYHLNFLPKCNY